jgi:cell division protein ZapA
MSRRTVDLRIAGQSYRVVSSAPEEDLKRFASVVSGKLAEVTPRGRAVQPQAMLLAAMALAHEVETERDQRAALERRTRDLLRRAMVRIDAALEPLEEPESAESE